MAELMKGFQHKNDERLCAFIEVVKVPENIREALIGSKPLAGESPKLYQIPRVLFSDQQAWHRNADWIVTNICICRCRRD